MTGNVRAAGEGSYGLLPIGELQKPAPRAELRETPKANPGQRDPFMFQIPAASRLPVPDWPKE
jgi:hypothetical protein